jgi:hypothetical protein
MELIFHTKEYPKEIPSLSDASWREAGLPSLSALAGLESYQP